MNEKKNDGAETERLEAIAKRRQYGLGFNGILMDYRYREMKPFISKGAHILELGPAEGHMTRLLRKLSRNITVVDGSRVFLDILHERYPEVKIIHALFEDADPGGTYDVIMMPHILEHVQDPVVLLKKYKQHLKDSGRLIISVPNAFSLNRLLGVEMGILHDPHELDEGDISIGHRRVYDPDLLAGDVRKAGLKIHHQGGVFLKLLSNAQMENNFTDEQIEGMYKLGRLFPRNCTELLCVCGKESR